MHNSKKITCSTDDKPGETKNTTSKSSIFAEEEWCSTYKNSIKNVDILDKYLPLNEEEKSLLKQVVKKYHMRIPYYYLSLIQDVSNPLDPVRRQCIPSPEELREEEHESIDPLGEEKTSPCSCLVHRYPDRVLLLVTGCCFMYCRHCTRKRLWNNKNFEPTLKETEQAFGYIEEHPEIREVIISGGDPLTLPTERIDYILSSISKLKQVEVIRIGTRAPVVFPERINGALCTILEKYDNLWINVQFNHPYEITPQSIQACRKLQKCGIPLSNQSVLLKGINDDPKVMIELCHKLQSIRIRPYYLFQCDPVVGAYHFRTSVFKGIQIMEKMRGHTSGMCIPTFVVDGVDGKGKVPLCQNYVVSISGEGITLRNHNNETFFYYNPKE